MNKNKQRLLLNYKTKWGLTDYRFFIACSNKQCVSNTLYIIKKDWVWNFIDLSSGIGSLYFELTSLHTLVKRLSSSYQIKLYDGNTPQIFDSEYELKHYLLTKKIAGV